MKTASLSFGNTKSGLPGSLDEFTTCCIFAVVNASRNTSSGNVPSRRTDCMSRLRADLVIVSVTMSLNAKWLLDAIPAEEQAAASELCPIYNSRTVLRRMGGDGLNSNSPEPTDRLDHRKRQDLSSCDLAENRKCRPIRYNGRHDRRCSISSPIDLGAKPRLGNFLSKVRSRRPLACASSNNR